jgi:hypothetical protein
MNAYETYQQYLGLKLYFEGNFDYFKYNGKTSASLTSFDKRKDKFKFIKLSTKLSDEQIIEYFVSNLISGKKYVGDFDIKTWQAHKKIVQSVEYNFSNDIEKLLTNVESFDILFQCDNGNHPILLKQYLGKKIKLETMVILERLTKFCKVFDKNITDTIIWPDVSQLITRYQPFLKVDVQKCNRIAITKVKEMI